MFYGQAGMNEFSHLSIAMSPLIIIFPILHSSSSFFLCMPYSGGKDLLKRKWKNLAEFVTLECDGKDITPKLKELRVHAIVFLNISSYGGGTHPWNKSGGQYEPATDDGLIEVVGLTTYQLVS